MRSLRPNICLAILAGIAVVGCNQPEDTASINTPPYDPAESRKELAEFFAYHQDQGLMADRSIADLHFIPGTTYLSGAGEARLARYAELMQTTGGQINYDTHIGDSSLVQGRLASARQFLSGYTIGNKTIDVQLGLAGGRGMSAEEAVAGRGVAQQPEPRNTAYKLESVGQSGSSN